MSKKQLLNEGEIRRFMKLANLEPLTRNVISEMGGPTVPSGDQEQQEEAADPMAAMPPPPAPDMGGDAMGGDDMSAEVELSGGDDEKLDMVSKFIEAGLKALGIEGSVEKEGDEGGEEMGGEEGEEEGGEEEGGEEEEEGGEEEEEGGEEEDEEEMQEVMAPEPKKLSEDELVEAVLARVTARLVSEAKKKKKMPVKAKMDAMKKKKAEKDEKAEDKKEKKMDEALEGVNLAEKGKEKHNVWKGHADMEMTKGEKGGKGGHEMETLAAKAEHTVTHGGKNLATLGGNKKK